MKTKSWMSAVVAFGFLCACGTPSLAGSIGGYGDYSNETNVHDTANVDLGHYIVGDEGSNNLLIVSNSITATASWMVIGAGGGTNNAAVFTDDAVLDYGAWYLLVGSNGTHNSMSILNGATIDGATEVAVGFGAGAAYNHLLVSGAGSTITNQQRMDVGFSGSGNSMEISDGAEVWVGGAANSRAYIGREAGSTHNAATVTGGGSLWDIYGYLSLGESANATHNRLDVEDGGRVNVTGNQYLSVGKNADAAALNISGGGSVSNEGVFYAGQAGNYATVTVHGAGSRLDIIRDNFEGRLRIGNTGSHNAMIISDGGTVLLTDPIPATATNMTIHIGSGAAANSNLLRVESGGVLTNNYASAELFVGASGSDNRLEVNGGQVHAGNLTIGRQSGSDGNVAKVSGSGYLEGGATMTIGWSGDNNLLEVDGGGSEVRGGNLKVGLLSGSTGNVVRVSGGGYLEAAGQYNFIGEAGSGNRLEVTGTGSEVYLPNYGLRVGYSTTVGGNAVSVTDGGVIVAGNGLKLGERGPRNSMLVDGAGAVAIVSNKMVIGDQATAYSNTVTVSGGGLLDSKDDVQVGLAGSYNRLEVDGTGSRLNAAGDLFVGDDAGAGSNVLQVTGGGLVISEAATYAGHFGSDNRIEVHGSNSRLFGPSLTIGRHHGSEGNILRVTGGGLVDSNLITYVGREGSYNSLEVDGTDSEIYAGHLKVGFAADSRGNIVKVSNGGYLEGDTFNFIGENGSSNRMEVTGAGSEVYLPGGLRSAHGAGSVDNSVAVSDGGRLVVGDLSRIGESGSRNRVEVHGSGSLFLGSNTVYVGQNASAEGNVLSVTGGGRVEATQLIIGDAAGSSGNQATLNGHGSTLAISGDVMIGNSGSGGSLVVEAGGIGSSESDTYVGYAAGSESNLLRVTGAGSSWTNFGTIYVSYGGGENNRLELLDGANIESANMEVGAGGTLELSNATLFVTAETNPFQVHADGVLRGSGTIEAEDFMNPPNDPFFIDGTVSPGFSTGTLEFGGDLALGANAVVVMEIAGDEDFDQIIVFDPWGMDAYGNLTFNGTLQLALLGGYEPQLHDSFQLFTANSYLDIEKMLIDDDNAQLQEGWSWQLNPDGSINVIPEATTLLLLLPAMLGLRSLANKRLV